MERGREIYTEFWWGYLLKNVHLEDQKADVVMTKYLGHDDVNWWVQLAHCV
jgi:hypothetical protein